MNKTKWGIALLSMLAAAGISQAAEGAKFWQIKNDLRLEYDDNIYSTSMDTQDSIKIVLSPTFQLSNVQQASSVFAEYTPSFVYWSDREDDFDLNHDLGLTAQHRFSDRWGAGLRERFVYDNDTALVEGGSLIRRDATYAYNSLNGDVDYSITPSTFTTLSGRWNLIRYQEDDTLADRNDFDTYVGGLDVGHRIIPPAVLKGELRLQDTDYKGPVNRDSTSYQIGVGYDHVFSPNLLGNIRGGYEYKEFTSADVKDTDNPYLDLTVTVVPTPATRLSLGGGYGMYEAAFFPYSNQQRTRIYASLAHDFTAKIAFYLTGSWQLSEYDAQQSATDVSSEVPILDGEEEILLVSSRLSYRLNQSNYLDLGWNYTDFTTDLRADYDRNRVSIGWKTIL